MRVLAEAEGMVSRADHSTLGQKVVHTGEVGQQVGHMAAVDRAVVHIAVEDQEVEHAAVEDREEDAAVGAGHLGDHNMRADEMGLGCIAGLGQEGGIAAGVLGTGISALHQKVRTAAVEQGRSIFSQTPYAETMFLPW